MMISWAAAGPTTRRSITPDGVGGRQRANDCPSIRARTSGATDKAPESRVARNHVVPDDDSAVFDFSGVRWRRSGLGRAGSDDRRSAERGGGRHGRDAPTGSVILYTAFNIALAHCWRYRPIPVAFG